MYNKNNIDGISFRIKKNPRHLYTISKINGEFEVSCKGNKIAVFAIETILTALNSNEWIKANGITTNKF